VHECVWVVAARREEPRLHEAPVLERFQPSAALREPHVARPATEQPALTDRIRGGAERAEPSIDRRRVHPDPVVGAANFMAPIQQRRRA
jgi:hypothetical protein